eukprot:CAMPEP_0206482118 /NCGR_PEP_ID=MMETSP0324_2-20121206/38664_1 /ASSEMBLY_ACC=CAM_ASM_000836 /TAXON_ID=2866 /ORGANISM="Crypthecodinium cohnii, Strain Seligo" /LENGTH=99 /DNA_ID=CAMNT_0053959965 /DNA_START=734 /DNA_END=1034 /DNA_ORIENTATION=-
MRSLTLVGGTASKCFAKASMVKQAMSIAMRAGSLQNTGALVRAASSSSKRRPAMGKQGQGRRKGGLVQDKSRPSLEELLDDPITEGSYHVEASDRNHKV